MSEPIDTIAKIVADWAENNEPDARVVAVQILRTIQQPTNQMINAGEAWRSHCSDTDSLWSEMVHAALYPESYPAEPHPLYRQDGAKVRSQ